MIKRFFDLFLTMPALILLSPLFLLFSLLIALNSKGGVFYRQMRVGKNGRAFKLIKFRSMSFGSDKTGLLTVGNDKRVTSIGRFLRKYKLDELPQLYNIVKGDMSIVGPRPEVKLYVDMYNAEQRKVLSVLPGLTDYASLEYFDENALLGNSNDPERTYINEVMPEKLKLNLRYIADQSFLVDLKIIFKTLLRIFRH